MRRLNKESLLKNKYNHLLCALIVLFISTPSLEVRDYSVSLPIGPLILLIALVAAVRAGLPKGAFLRAFLIFAFVSFVVNLLVYFLPETHIKAIEIMKFISGGTTFLFFSITVYFLTKRLFRIHKVTADTIKGGISAYLLIGFVFATLYGLLIQVYPDAFITTSHKEMMCVHFSFTTLTTLGYGDIVPNGRFAALLTNSEAIIGQLYLTVLVARLVGLYIVTEKEDSLL